MCIAATSAGHLLIIEEAGHDSDTFVHSATLFTGYLEKTSGCLNCVPYPPGKAWNPYAGNPNYFQRVIAACVARAFTSGMRYSSFQGVELFVPGW